ncbi:MAG TPA: zf-HC2 domain-containing protein, partial [Candidatus Limnocylindrales bacterium]|nr:zf-HC2 domain-containing protein [Candidatus Limnocylindrales bacterium]
MLRRIVGPKRRPDDWSTPHERALVRLSDRLDGPLEADEAAWLDEHLAGCEDCRAAAVAYEEERIMLRGLAMPEAPRDLQARTFAAIEAEEARRRGGARVAGVPARKLAPYGALGSLLIVGLVVGATAFAPV